MSVTIQNKGYEVKWWTFPGGERGVKVTSDRIDPSLCIDCRFTGSDDLIDVLLLTNALRNYTPGVALSLFIPYFPYARQDRVMSSGEAFALQVAVDLIKSCNFNEVNVLDPHSDVLAGMFPAGVLKVVPQSQIMWKMLYPQNLEKTALISPDAGALKKIYPLAKKLNLPTIEAGKTRNVETGEVTGSKIDLFECCKYNMLIIVDDICDGGKTFIELGKLIRTEFKGTLILITTHGIYSKGMEVFKGIFNDVICYNKTRD